MHKRSFLITCVFLTASAWAQGTGPQTPCSQPESRQFDFWIGKWDLTYKDSVHASNTVSAELGTCAIQENFSDPNTKLQGRSWSVYSPRLKKWQQTWVDNQGGYIALTGGMEEGKMVLYTQPFTNPKGVQVQNRMVYYNIKDDSFDWSWEATQDGGKTWKVNWLIHYQRI